MRRGREMLIALTTAAAFGQNDALSVFGEVGQHLVAFRVAHDRSDRKLDDYVLTAAARTVGAQAVLAAFGAPFRPELKVIESVESPAGLDQDGTARSAVATRGASARHIFLAAECYAASSPVACFDKDGGLIDKHA